jgi:hypothetical protein
VIVYRELGRAADPRRLIDRCRELARQNAAEELLVEFGELEAGLADALFPERDDAHPLADAGRAAALAVARRYRGERIAVEPSLDALDAHPLPSRVTVKPAEGYAFYGLLPESYLEAAAAFARGRGPGHAVCIGLRAIGTSLSALVAAELRARGWSVELLTLRPRGHPFDRRAELTPELRARLHRRPDAHLLIVDEGPGLSGSSFAGAAAALDAPDERIVFFPSWLPDTGSFVSASARERWPRHEKAHAPFRVESLGPGLRDLSAGAWRDLLGVRPAVQPQHERRKHLSPDGRLLKFVGLGRRGRAICARAAALAEAGFSPPVEGWRRGFIEHPFIAARPGRLRHLDGPLLARAVDYLAQRGRRFACAQAANPAPLAAMMEANLGWSPPWPEPAPAVLLDNRLAPHEWLRIGETWLKADSVDHAADHFFPGPHDLAWDVAGFGVEFGLDGPAMRDFAEAVGGAARDLRLPQRLPFYRTAYLAFRLGYAELARQTLGNSPDSRRFAYSARRLRRLLEAEPPPSGRRC